MNLLLEAAGFLSRDVDDEARSVTNGNGRLATCIYLARRIHRSSYLHEER
jgi:hypothetical protein